MKTYLIALFFILGVTSYELISGDEDAMRSLWSSWKLQYGKSYTDTEEPLRFEIFKRNYDFIVEWNAEGNTATLSLNQFADLSSEEFGSLYMGTYPTPHEIREANTEIFFNVGDIPTSWDWRTQGAVEPVKDQGQCGSCWAFATVACVEGLNFLNKKPLTSFSEQQIVDCDTTCYGCNGGWPYKAFQYVAQYGLELETDYPYTAKTGSCQYNAGKAQKGLDSNYAFVTPRNPAQLKAAIYQQPVAVIVEADQQVFQFYSSGVITTGCGTSLDHAITAIGYGSYSGQDSFFVRNSWGASWGVSGYVYISTSTQYNAGLGACGILSEPQYPKQ